MVRGKTYRSKFEHTIATRYNLSDQYETTKLTYVVPSSEHSYTCDFFVEQNGKKICFESKGQLTREDRAKMIRVRDQHPEIEFIFIFMNPNNKISKQSLTSYSDWCNKNKFKYCTIDTIGDHLNTSPK